MEVHQSLRWRVSNDKKKNGAGLERDRAKRERILLKRLLKSKTRKKRGRQNAETMIKDAGGTKKLSDPKRKPQKKKDRGRKERKTVKDVAHITKIIKTQESKARKKHRLESIKRNLEAKTLEELLNQGHENQDNDHPQLDDFSSSSKSENTRHERSKKYVEISEVMLLAQKYVRRAELWKEKYHQLKNKLQAAEEIRAAEADRLSNSFDKSLLISNQN